MKRVTLKDIAGQTGLDISTVSRVLNRAATVRISPDKRAEVLRIAQELGYVPDRTARSLRLQRNFLLGYALTGRADRPSSVQTMLEFPATRARLYGLEAAASHHGYLLSLIRISEENAVAQHENALRLRQVDGFVYNWFTPAETVQRHKEAGIPAVIIDPQMPEDAPMGALSCVLSDRATGVKQALGYLAERGHRRIAFVSYFENVRRYAGYRTAVEEYGLDADPRLTRLFASTESNAFVARAEGQRATRELLQSGATFTAVQAGSDATAAGVIDALKEAGRRVPEDVAVIGYDDVEGYNELLLQEPFLTTIRDPNYEMGVQAIELLIGQIERGTSAQQVTLQPQLVLRHSA